MKSRFYLVATLVILILLSMSCKQKKNINSTDSTTLRLNLPKGYSTVVRKTEDSDYTHIMEQKTFQGKKHSVDEYLLECTDVDSSGLMTIKQTHKTAKVRNVDRTGTSEYDSTKPQIEASPETASLAAKINKSITILVTPAGGSYRCKRH